MAAPRPRPSCSRENAVLRVPQAFGFDNTLNRGVKGRGGNAALTCPPGTSRNKGHGDAPRNARTASYCRKSGYPLVSAWGWVLSALLQVSPEHAAPSPARAGTPAGLQLSEFVTDIPATVLGAGVSPYNYTVGAVKSKDAVSGQLSYLILHFSPDSNERLVRRFRLELSAADLHTLGLVVNEHTGAASGAGGCAGLTLSQQALNTTTCVHQGWKRL